MTELPANDLIIWLRCVKAETYQKGAGHRPSRTGIWCLCAVCVCATVCGLSRDVSWPFLTLGPALILDGRNLDLCLTWCVDKQPHLPLSQWSKTQFKPGDNWLLEAVGTIHWPMSTQLSKRIVLKSPQLWSARFWNTRPRLTHWFPWYHWAQHRNVDTPRQSHLN